MAAAADDLFDLDAGRSCLDFANTLTFSGKDQLATYADLVAFAAQSSLITQDEADWLRTEAQRDASSANAVLARARRLRDALRSIFTDVAQATAPDDDDLAVLNANLAASLSHARLAATADDAGGRYAWAWSALQLTSPIWPITRSAADVLTSDQERRLVRQCGAEDCAWLFLDTSKNRTRQWCSMKSCGNREKARRHYMRQRATRRPSASPSASTPNAGSAS